VAGARTVSEFADSGVLVRTGPVIIGVAAGTIGFIGRKLPADDFIIRGVATEAGHARAVSAWEERRRMTVIENRQPGGGAVTGITRACRHEVTTGFAGGGRAIMTGRARTRRNRIVVKGRGLPRRGGVTGIAGRRRDNVCRGLTGGGRTIVARGTGTRRNGAVIHGRR